MQSVRFVLRTVCPIRTICPPLIKAVRTICLRTVCPRQIRAKKQSVRFVFRTICLQTIVIIVTIVTLHAFVAQSYHLLPTGTIRLPGQYVALPNRDNMSPGTKCRPFEQQNNGDIGRHIVPATYCPSLRRWTYCPRIPWPLGTLVGCTKISKSFQNSILT